MVYSNFAKLRETIYATVQQSQTINKNKIVQILL